MKDNFLKRCFRKLFFPNGAVRKILIGPLRGHVYRVNEITGMAPWYSGTERSLQRLFKKLVVPGDVVIDIGANWGLHTLHLSRLVGGSGRVLAFECFPPAFEELQWHCKANGCENVEILQIAICDLDGEGNFSVGQSAYTGRLSNEDPHPGKIQVRTLSVTTRSLDSIVKESTVNNLKLVKMDVEGGETRVLKGATEIIVRYKPYFVIELHTPEQDVSVAKILTSRGYRLERLSGPPILRTDVGWPEKFGVWGHILASPP